jgi:hypothetical protein
LTENSQTSVGKLFLRKEFSLEKYDKKTFYRSAGLVKIVEISVIKERVCHSLE